MAESVFNRHFRLSSVNFLIDFPDCDQISHETSGGKGTKVGLRDFIPTTEVKAEKTTIILANRLLLHD